MEPKDKDYMDLTPLAGEAEEQEPKRVLYIPTPEELGEEPVQKEEQPPKKETFFETLNSMPTALTRFAVKNFLLTLAFILVGIVAFAVTWKLQFVALCLVGVLMTGWNGVSVVLDYRAGRIIERVLICTGATYNRGGTALGAVMGKLSAKRVRLTFRDTNEEAPTYYQYIVTDKVRNFVISGVYLTYVRASTPQLLLAYHLL